jgi:hypothetical protein
MTNRSLYRELAANGNEDAQVILDSEEEGAEVEETEDAGEGATPEAEMGAENSEEQKAGKLAQLHEKVGGLMVKAQMHAATGAHHRAASAHAELAQLHEGAGDNEKALASYKDAAVSYAQHVDAMCSMAPEQLQAWHARENAGK